MLTNQVRIISGRWRGRKMVFPSIEGLRPTSDRLKETLFNWLKPSIEGSVCLDAFSGSGALGFEAASRGAKEVILLEQSSLVAKQLQENKEKFKAENITVCCGDAINYLNTTNKQFDIIFLDPPFAKELAQQSLIVIQEKKCLTEAGILYLEQPKNKPLQLQNWEILKEKTMGHVTARLLKPTEVK